MDTKKRIIEQHTAYLLGIIDGFFSGNEGHSIDKIEPLLEKAIWRVIQDTLKAKDQGEL